SRRAARGTRPLPRKSASTAAPRGGLALRRRRARSTAQALEDALRAQPCLRPAQALLQRSVLPPAEQFACLAVADLPALAELRDDVRHTILPDERLGEEGGGAGQPARQPDGPVSGYHAHVGTEEFVSGRRAVIPRVEDLPGGSGVGGRQHEQVDEIVDEDREGAGLLVEQRHPALLCPAGEAHRPCPRTGPVDHAGPYDHGLQRCLAANSL